MGGLAVSNTLTLMDGNKLYLGYEDVYQKIQSLNPYLISRASSGSSDLVEGHVFTWTCWSHKNYEKLQSGESYVE